MTAVDVHPHYVPRQLIQETKRHGKALGVGFLPYHLGRFDKEFTTGTKARPSKSSKAPSAYLKNLYFDTLVCDVNTLEYLKASAALQVFCPFADTRKIGGSGL